MYTISCQFPVSSNFNEEKVGVECCLPVSDFDTYKILLDYGTSEVYKLGLVSGLCVVVRLSVTFVLSI